LGDKDHAFLGPEHQSSVLHLFSMKVAELRNSLRLLAPAAHPARPLADKDKGDGFATGFVELDGALGAGGIPRGTLTEISGGHSSGKTTLAFSLLAQLTRYGKNLAAFIDGQGHFYPPMAAAQGVELSHLLLVRLHNVNDLQLHATRAADILIRSRHFPLVIVDLPPQHHFAHKRCLRLCAAVQATGGSIVILTHHSQRVEKAGLRLRAQSTNTRNSQRELTLFIQKGGQKGGHSLQSQVQLKLSPLRIDHAPPLPAAPAVQRITPGTPPLRAGGAS
jgi:hypothetical protein